MRQGRIWSAAAALLLTLLLGCSAQEPGAQVLNLTQTPLTNAQAIQLQNHALALAEACRTQLPEPGQTANYALTQKQVQELVRWFAEQGLTVIDADGACNMENPELVQAFGQAIKAGKDASVTVYRIYRDGGFSRTELVCQNGKMFQTNIRIAWDETMTPQIIGISRRDILQMDYTEKGYLIWRVQELDSVQNGPDYVPYQMVRVEPLDEICRELCRTYIRPVGYANSNLFLTDWTMDDTGDLVWNDVFPACFFLQTGVLLTSHTCGGYVFDAGVGLLIPEADYVRYITTYFPVEPECLTALSHRDPASGCYPVRLFTSADMAQRLPTPEVVAWRENSDGSVTLTVDALDLERGTDCAFSHAVTVMPLADGSWYYLRNQMLSMLDEPDATAG